MEIFSPVHKVVFSELQQAQIELYIKRDDLIHPFVSGNKWRKLKYHLRAMKEAHKTKLVTFGGAFSNHLLATAVAGAIFGIKTIGIVRGEEVQNDTLFLCQLHGMELQFADRESYRDKEYLFEQKFGEDNATYYVGEGGSGILGIEGCKEIINEISEPYHHIFCACGTGTTAIGLAQGLENKASDMKLNVVPVLKDSAFLQQEIQKQVQQPFNFHPQYHFGGYAKTTVELLHFVRYFTQKTGIMLDPIYTGKAMFALFDLVKQGYFAPQSSILFLHTGGLIGTLGMKARFD